MAGRGRRCGQGPDAGEDGPSGGLDQLLDTDEGDWGLGHTSLHDRFAEDDLPSILNHHATDATGQAPPQVRTGL